MGDNNYRDRAPKSINLAQMIEDCKRSAEAEQLKREEADREYVAAAAMTGLTHG